MILALAGRMLLERGPQTLYPFVDYSLGLLRESPLHRPGLSKYVESLPRSGPDVVITLREKLEESWHVPCSHHPA